MTMSMEEAGRRIGEEIYYEHMCQFGGDKSWYDLSPDEQEKWHRVGLRSLAKATHLLNVAASGTSVAKEKRERSWATNDPRVVKVGG